MASNTEFFDKQREISPVLASEPACLTFVGSKFHSALIKVEAQMTEPAQPPASIEPDLAPLWSQISGGAVVVSPLNSAIVRGPGVCLLFDAINVEMSSDDRTGLSTVRCASAHAMPNVGDRPTMVEISYELRGEVLKDPDARVAMLIDFGGTLRTAEYGYGSPATERIEIHATGRREVRPFHHLPITLLVTGERLHGKAAAKLWIDFLAAEITILQPHAGGESAGGE